MSKDKKDVFAYGGSGRGQRSIREPLQERSRKNMDRIMDSLESLLEEKPFDRITMAELARKSGVGTSSIYARFSDKSALILGVHVRLRENALQCLEDLVDPARWEGASVDEIVRHIIPNVIHFYRKHAFLIRAALFVDDVVVRERQASVLRVAAEKLGDLFPAANPKGVKKVDMAIDASVRIVTSVMYSTLMFGDVSVIRTPVSDIELARQLSRAVITLISDAEVARS